VTHLLLDVKDVFCSSVKIGCEVVSEVVESNF